MKKKIVVLDCERMKYANTGLYHYCMQLGMALQKVMASKEHKLFFYVRKVNEYIFGNTAWYLLQKGVDKFFMPTNNVALWHCTYQASNYFPFRKKVKVVYTIHDLNILHETGYSPSQIEKALSKIQQRIDRADYVVVISNFTLQDVTKNLQLRQTPIKVIYNGCNFDKIEKLQPPQHAIHNNFIFTIGTINAKKNFHVLPCLLEGNHKILLIAGITHDENYKQKIIEEAIKYNVQDRVIFLGAINENDKQWYLQQCEAFVFPSLAEGFGLPVIEAMYFGKPIILSNLTALPEVGGKLAYYFNNFNAADMQLIYKNALAHYHSHNDLPLKIKEHALQFNWDTTAAQYLQVYNSLLTPKSIPIV